MPIATTTRVMDFTGLYFRWGFKCHTQDLKANPIVILAWRRLICNVAKLLEINFIVLIICRHSK